MADEAASSSTGPPPSEDLLVNISIVSPSLSVTSPLAFPNLPSSTTISQLKQRVRDSLDSKPSNEQQRLIHQGKLLARENETLLEVFGAQKIRDSDQLVVHLVIRDAVDHLASSSQTTAPRGQSPAQNPDPRGPTPLFGPNGQPIPHIHPLAHHPHQTGRFGRPGAMPGHAHSPFAGPAFGIPTPPGNQMPAQLMAQQHQLLHQYMNQLNQRAAMNQGQQARAGTGSSGQDQAGNPHYSPGNNSLGRNSPHPHPFPEQQPQPYVREGVGPNGELYRVTMNSAFIGPNGQVHSMNQPNLQPGHAPHAPPAPGVPFSTNDLQNILRNADASHATSMMTNAMHRSASGASLANLNLNNQRQPIQTPGVTLPRRPGSTVPLSRTATPDPSRASANTSTPTPANTTARSTTLNQPEVYILNSPQGPRALLMNSPSELYYTPATRISAPPMMAAFNPAWFQPQLRTGTAADAAQPPVPPQAAAAAPPQQQAPQQGNVRVNLYQGPAAQQPAQQQHPFVPRMEAALRNQGFARHPGNPEGGAAGAVLAALWPHVWLLIRLGVFVWWFTSSDTSWTRWLIVMSVATAVFLANTGLFNGMANDVRNIVRQHLEGFVPLAGPDLNRNRRDNNPAADPPHGQEGNNDAGPRAEPQQGNPDPAQAAARLVEQHRERNANWVLNQIRRLERAGLLFLASIAPGVAERHIQQLEAQERAERERQEAAERAERERREEQERAAAEVSAEGATDGNNTGEAAGGHRDENTSASGGEQQQLPVAAA